MANPDAIPNLRRSIRTDKQRELFDRCIAAGWSARRDGKGHIRLTAPDGAHLTMSGTAVAQGRGIKNNEAVFKRWQRQQEAVPMPNPAIERAIDNVENNALLDALGVKHGVVPNLPPLEETPVEQPIEQQPEQEPVEEDLKVCPTCGKQFKTMGFGPHLASHQPKATPKPAPKGNGALFTIDEVVTIANYGGDAGLVEVRKLEEGLRMIAALRGDTNG